MKILVLADNFTPEIVATSFRTHEHAREWLRLGHEVTVVTCAPNWPHGKVFEGYRNRPYQQETIDGIRVIRLGTYITANRGFVKRTLDYVSFMMAAVMWCWRFPKCDVIVATSPQFFTAVAGWMLSVVLRKPWVFELRDLWPDSIKAVGVSQGRLIRWLERLELFLYRRANRIVAVTHAFRENLRERGIDPRKIDVVTNGVDLEQFSSERVMFDARAKLDVPSDSFLVGYIGTTGMAHGLETLIEAARLCSGRADIQFVILGEGAERERLEGLANELGLTNLWFFNRVPHHEMPSYLAAFDLPVIHLRPDPVFRTVIPSKLFEFMAMSKPVLMAVEGEAAGIVEQAGCGICIASGDASEMANAIMAQTDRRHELRRIGAAGRRVVETSYSRPVKARLVLESLEAARGTRPAAAWDESVKTADATPSRNAA